MGALVDAEEFIAKVGSRAHFEGEGEVLELWRRYPGRPHRDFEWMVVGGVRGVSLESGDGRGGGGAK